MNTPQIRLTVITRVYPHRCSRPRKAYENRTSPLLYGFGERVLVFDTETRDEPGQRLLFGSFQIREADRLVHRGLIMGDECDAKEKRILRAFAAEHQIQLYSREDFVTLLMAEVAELGTTCIAYNLPWDLSRLAVRWRQPRGDDGSFKLHLSYNSFKPHVRVTHIARNKAFISMLPSVERKRR